MLTLDQHIKLDAAAIAAVNLCDRFTTEDLQKIGHTVCEGYRRDKTSRYKWERRTQAAMDLAMQVSKEKNFPWPGCSNVAFPLVTIASLQFHSRAYPALISGPDVVKCRVIGEDETGEKTQRAKRISTHMSWQVLEEDRAWEPQKDTLLISLPIVGTVFTKSYWDAGKGHRVDETVLAQNLVLDYWAKSVEACPRKTHLIPMFRNDLHSKIKRKTFRDVTEEAWYSQAPAVRSDASTVRQDNRQGILPPIPDETTPFPLLEQHVGMDLDGDGYAEPYIITVEETSEAVLRIVTGFDRPEDIERTREGEIIAITPIQYFTKYSFIPSPDGGIYDVGFGVLLGPLNESTNSLINQLTDAGTMQTTKGGFLGRGAKIRGGVYTFSPLEWKRVDSSGDDLKKNIVPLEVGEPSAVLFQLLGLLINYVERISGTTDPMVGENPGQNTPAETMRTMVQEGSRVYSGIHKRIWRSMKEEFRKGYILNGIYMPARRAFGRSSLALREDYLGNPDEVAPAADPNITSDQMAMAQAQLLKAAAASTPGYNLEEVERRFLKSMKIDAIEQVYPGVAKTGAPKDVKLQIAELKLQGEQLWMQFEGAKLQSQQQQFVMELMEEQRMNNAEIARIQAEIALKAADIEGDAEDREIARLNAMLGVLKSRDEVLMKRIDAAIKLMELRNEAGNSDGRGVRRLAGASSNAGGSRGAGGSAAGASA
jgi:chaperonin GroES